MSSPQGFHLELFVTLAFVSVVINLYVLNKYSTKVLLLRELQRVYESKAELAEHTAHQSKFYEQVLNTVGDLLFVVDESGSIVLANEAMGLFLGVTPDNMQGKPLMDFLHGGDAKVLITQDVQILKSGKTVQALDFKLMNYRGEPRHFNLNKRLLVNGRTLIVTVASDVTTLHNILQATRAEHAEITQQFERYVKLG